MKVTINDGQSTMIKEVKDLFIYKNYVSIITADGCCYDANSNNISELTIDTSFDDSKYLWIKTVLYVKYPKERWNSDAGTFDVVDYIENAEIKIGTIEEATEEEVKNAD